MSIRLSAGPGNTFNIDENGPYTAPVESGLLHRFKLRDGAVVDTYLGLNDDEVRAWDAAHPGISPEAHAAAALAEEGAEPEPEAVPAKD